MRVKFTVLFTLVTLAVRVSSQAAAPLEFTRRAGPSRSPQGEPGPAIPLQDLPQTPSPAHNWETQQRAEDAPGGHPGPSTSHALTPSPAASHDRDATWGSGSATSLANLVEVPSPALIPHHTLNPPQSPDGQQPRNRFGLSPQQDKGLRGAGWCIFAMIGVCSICLSIAYIVKKVEMDEHNSHSRRSTESLVDRRGSSAESPKHGQAYSNDVSCVISDRIINLRD
ncbi:hypothetical protein EV361DRAFT_938494 [Lentinula raphanica]|nr:hypothetical protein EV361DRAFT_938494 [Lentinula raphanica]